MRMNYKKLMQARYRWLLVRGWSETDAGNYMAGYYIGLQEAAKIFKKGAK